MRAFWDGLVALFRRSVGREPVPPRLSPWVLVGRLASEAGLQCQFCGRVGWEAGGSPDRQGDVQFALVQARHNPRLQHIVCGQCLEWNRIGSS